jgi:hypothetical protein
MKKMLCNAAIVFAAVLGVVSCENDLTPLGASFLGEDPAGIIKETEFDVKAYSAPVNPVQTSNFNSFPFGVYDDPVYGTSTYEFVTQVNLGFASPDVGNNAQLLNVRIEVPYYSTAISVENEVTTYRLDSLYGQDPVQLEIFRSGYFLNSFNPNEVSERAVYYSNFEGAIESNQLELISSDNSFFPDLEEIPITETELVDGVEVVTTLERLSPRYRDTTLSIQRWKEIMFNLDPVTNEIIDARAELASISAFQDYFRGLYFKVAGATGNGNMIHFNLNQAKIVLTIQSDSDVVDVDDGDMDGDTTDFVANPESEITINFNGNKVGFIDNNFTPSIVSDILESSSNPLSGAENLYLKGGAGSLAIIELFGQATSTTSGEAPSLTTVIENDWLINDAYIDFYVNRSITTAGSKDPERILIYDYDTNRLLSDYVIGNAAGLDSNLSHLGRLERIDNDDTATDREKYRIRLTQHLNNIVQGNLENARLAIVVSQNVSIIGNSSVLNTVNPNPDLELIPISSAISHEGTVLHGNLSSDLEKRPKLKVFYSETRRAN